MIPINIPEIFFYIFGSLYQWGNFVNTHEKCCVNFFEQALLIKTPKFSASGLEAFLQTFVRAWKYATLHLIRSSDQGLKLSMGNRCVWVMVENFSSNQTHKVQLSWHQRLLGNLLFPTHLHHQMHAESFSTKANLLINGILHTSGLTINRWIFTWNRAQLA